MKKVKVLMLLSIFFYSCSIEIDSRSEESYQKSLTELKSELSKIEKDSIGKCMLAILSKSGHTIFELDKIMNQFNGMTANDIFEEGAIIFEEARKKEVAQKRLYDSIRAIEIIDSIALYNEQGLWKIKHFVDDFQEETKEGYVSTDGLGVFSNSAVTKRKLSGKIVVTNKEKVQLFLYEYESQQVKSYSSRTTPEYLIKVQDKNSEYKTYAELYSDRLIFTQHAKLIASFRKGGEIKVYLREQSNYSVGSTYLLMFDVTNFDEAFKKLSAPLDL